LYACRTKNTRPETANQSQIYMHKGSPHSYMCCFFMFFPHKQEFETERDGGDITAGDALSYIQFMKKKEKTVAHKPGDQ
jgi:hypothetical protein